MFKMFGSVLGFVAATVILVVAGSVAWAVYASYQVRQWDARIDALCAANGGKDVETRVYETVMAPETKEYFRETTPIRSLGVPSRPEGVTLGSRYPFVSETRVVEVLKRDNPSVVKYTERIVRTTDNKILGERYGYQRGGGGIPGIDPFTIRTCPALQTSGRLDVRVFLNHPMHDSRNMK